MNSKLSHVDDHNNPQMVDVSNKKNTFRTARAESRIGLPDAVKAAIQGGDIQSKKGPVFHTAIIAGVMAAKRTHELIPFCHPLGILDCSIDIQPDSDDNIVIQCQVKVEGKTGVEMEALTGCTVAALTLYDMCKAISQDMVIEQTRLVLKTGGKSDINK
ncbi:cyclic pyranopterin monophosphate synthase MoaC [Marinicella sp. W31]|uniref:cyclic pyranopterin monophosphate synthase MoaC n=1 Tax=Marinicella sp. W31 TaxID=3023713 RepID=UPI00375715F5